MKTAKEGPATPGHSVQPPDLFPNRGGRSCYLGQKPFRPGAAGVMTLLAIPLLLLIVGLVVYVGLIRIARQESQTGADAAALSAALNSPLMISSPRIEAAPQNRIQRSRLAAQTLGHLNLAAGDHLDLDPNLSHDPDGDIVFGHMKYPGCGQFTAVDANPDSWTGGHRSTRFKSRLVGIQSWPPSAVLLQIGRSVGGPWPCFTGRWLGSSRSMNRQSLSCP